MATRIVLDFNDLTEENANHVRAMMEAFAQITWKHHPAISYAASGVLHPDEALPYSLPEEPTEVGRVVMDHVGDVWRRRSDKFWECITADVAGPEDFYDWGALNANFGPIKVQ